MSIRLLVKLVQILLGTGVTCLGASHSPIGKVADCPINWRVSLCIATDCKNDFTPPTTRTRNISVPIKLRATVSHLYLELFSRRLLTAARIDSYSRLSPSVIYHIFYNRLNN